LASARYNQPPKKYPKKKSFSLTLIQTLCDGNIYLLPKMLINYLPKNTQKSTRFTGTALKSGRRRPTGVRPTLAPAKSGILTLSHGYQNEKGEKKRQQKRPPKRDKNRSNLYH